MTVSKLLSDHGFLFTPERAKAWRYFSEQGTIAGLPSFGTCTGLATDGVHVICLTPSRSYAIEVSATNWIKSKPSDYGPSVLESKPVKEKPSSDDIVAKLLTSLLP